MVTKRLLAPLLVSVLVAGCQVQGVNLQPLMNAAGKSSDLMDKDEQQEIEIGHRASEALLKNSSVLQNDQLQQYVNRVGVWLSLHTERPDLPWRVVVLNDSSFNAFAVPGGTLYITWGTLTRLESEAELAAILAHEMAHVLEKHHLDEIKTQAKIDIGMELARMFDNDSGNQPDMATMGFQGKSFEDQFTGAVNTLYSTGLERGDELEADEMGIVITARAGYDPWALIQVLQKIGSEQGESGYFESFVKRHPDATDRIDALESVLSRPFISSGNYLTLRDRYQRYVR